MSVIFDDQGLVIDETSPGTFKVVASDGYHPNYGPDPHRIIEAYCEERVEAEFRRSLTPSRVAWLKRYWQRFMAGRPRPFKEGV